MTDIAIIADKDTLTGFRLAGIINAAEFNETTIKETLEKFNDAKILIMTEKVVTYIRENDLMQFVQATVAEIPDKSGSTGHALEELSQLFESAIGVALKQEE
jgi:vacuolar-type H+-ATPase subunit F/Vma7